jgi:hypothetical protein
VEDIALECACLTYRNIDEAAVGAGTIRVIVRVRAAK